MINHFVYQPVISSIIKFKQGISHVSSVPQVIAASHQTNAGIGRPNVLVANRTTVPLTFTVFVDRLLQDAGGIDVKNVILPSQPSVNEFAVDVELSGCDFYRQVYHVIYAIAAHREGRTIPGVCCELNAVVGRFNPFVILQLHVSNRS